MKIFLTSMLLLQFLLNEARANLDGQTSERVPLLKEDGTATGTAITCSPYSVEDDTNNVEFVKYVLDTDEEANTTVVWNSQSNLSLFEECASYAAEQNVGMFYFDGQTCETSDTVYERKEKTCDSTTAKMVYMQKGFQPAVITNCVENGTTYDEGDVWGYPMALTCGRGRKKCVNGVIITERNYWDSSTMAHKFTPHVEGVDYIPTTDSTCFMKPVLSTGKAAITDQVKSCQLFGNYPCSIVFTLSGINSSVFTEQIKAFLDSPLANSMTTSELNVGLFRVGDSTAFKWGGGYTTTTFDIPGATNFSNNCIVFAAADSHSPSESNCNEIKERDICCLRY